MLHVIDGQSVAEEQTSGCREAFGAVCGQELTGGFAAAVAEQVLFSQALAHS